MDYCYFWRVARLSKLGTVGSTHMALHVVSVAASLQHHCCCGGVGTLLNNYFILTLWIIGNFWHAA